MPSPYQTKSLRYINRATWSTADKNATSYLWDAKQIGCTDLLKFIFHTERMCAAPSTRLFHLHNLAALHFSSAFHKFMGLIANEPVSVSCSVQHILDLFQEHPSCAPDQVLTATVVLLWLLHLEWHNGSDPILEGPWIKCAQQLALHLKSRWTTDVSGNDTRSSLQYIFSVLSDGASSPSPAVALAMVSVPADFVAVAADYVSSSVHVDVSFLYSS